MSIQIVSRLASFRTCIAFLLVTLAAQAASAQIPFFVVGSAGGDGFSVAGFPSTFGSKGFSFPVGRYRSDDGIAISQSFDPLVGSGTFKGTFTFENRRGHKLATTFGDPDNGAQEIGTYMAIPVGEGMARILFIAEFNPIVGQSTGSFRNVSGGSLVMYALTEPIPLTFDEQGFSVPFTFNWIGSGSLQFSASDDD